ncbi:MAG: type II toxin-antitoxin system RelE/ParE family toxin [Gammaproteobacteria bacterium]
MIKTFKCRETEGIYHGSLSRRIPRDIQRVAARKLEMLSAATRLESLQVPPGNKLEKLRGDRAGQYSIRINEQWRLCFVWQDGDAYNVEIVDYH